MLALLLEHRRQDLWSRFVRLLATALHSDLVGDNIARAAFLGDLVFRTNQKKRLCDSQVKLKAITRLLRSRITIDLSFLGHKLQQPLQRHVAFTVMVQNLPDLQSEQWASELFINFKVITDDYRAFHQDTSFLISFLSSFVRSSKGCPLSAAIAKPK